MDVNLGIQIPAFTGPRGRSFGPFDFNTGDTELAQGDTAFAPLVLGWDAGNLLGTSPCSASRPPANTRGNSSPTPA
jgi:hypothetical protein